MSTGPSRKPRRRLCYFCRRREGTDRWDGRYYWEDKAGHRRRIYACEECYEWETTKHAQDDEQEDC